MQTSIIKGSSFGLASGIITTLGLISGLYSGTGSRMVVIGGIITIAIADAFSDALGIHISEESDASRTNQQVWSATIATFASKFFFAILFVIPFLLLELFTAIVISIVWGLLAISILSYYIARWQKETPSKVITEHLLIAILVIAVTNVVGQLVSSLLS